MGLFSKGKKEANSSSIIQLVDQKTRLLRSKFDHSRDKEHTHYFSKRDIDTKGIDPLCKVCGLPLSKLTLERKLEKLNTESGKIPE